jgi:hypothetical protein
MLDFLLRPLQPIVGIAQREVQSPLEDTERQIVDASNALRRASDSIEHHVEVLEGLATAVAPLTDSVDRLTATMSELVAVLGPVALAERGVERVEHLVRLHHHGEGAGPAAERPEPE